MNMSITKFYIYAGRRWRAVDTASGRVEGWGAAQCQFVSLRRGRLQRVRRGEVLRGLRTLAAGRPTSVRDGPQLSQIRNTNDKTGKAKKKDCNDNENRHHCCRFFNYHCNSDAIFDRLLNQPVNNNVGTTVVPTETIGIQCTITDTPTAKIQPDVREIYPTHDNARTEVLRTAVTKKNKSPKIRVLEKRKRSNDGGKDHKAHKKQNRGRKVHSDVEFSTSEETAKPQNKVDQLCKELQITEDEVLLIRSFIEHDTRDIFGFNLERYDSDDYYKSIVFFKLNPLVQIERNRDMDEMLYKNNRENISIKDFMSHLGLQSLEEASMARSRCRMRPRPSDRTIGDCESNKENTSKPKSNSRKEPNLSLAKKNNSIQVSSESEDEVEESIQRVLRKRLSTNRIFIKNRVNEVRVNKAKENSNQSGAPRRQLMTRSSRGDNKAKEKRPAPVEALVKVNETVDLSRDSDSDDRSMASGRSNLLQQRSLGQRKDPRCRAGGETQDVPEDSVSNYKVQREERPAPKAARGRGGGPRDYSPAEDAALLRLVRAGGRARLVNGNRLWKEMEDEYQRATGIYRSWHSLRNRYLRYVLPALGSSSLPLPPGEAVRLRSDAAQGKLKNRKLQPQYDSLFNNKNNNNVMSAWSRRPRSPPRESLSPSPSSPPRSLPPPTDGNDPDFSTSWKTFKRIRENIITSKSDKRSLRSDATAAGTGTGTDTPTYADLTRRFAMKHSTPDSAATTPNTRTSGRLSHKKDKTDRHVQLIQTKNFESSYRENQRSSSSRSSTSEEQDSSRDEDDDSNRSDSHDDRRKSLRSSSGAAPAPPPPPPRTRRLYNPNVL